MYSIYCKNKNVSKVYLVGRESYVTRILYLFVQIYISECFWGYNYGMFLSIKRKFSSALMNTVILLVFLFCLYLGKQVKITWYENIDHYNWLVEQVSDLNQQYQKANRLQSYLTELEDLITFTDKLQHGAEGVNQDFKLVQSAMKDSLKINLKHEN